MIKFKRSLADLFWGGPTAQRLAAQRRKKEKLLNPSKNGTARPDKKN
jgi:hypothetical protein